MFVSVAWHVPSDLYRLIVSAAGNIPPKNASDIFPSLGISEARLPTLVGVIASIASDDRSEFTQAHTRSIASKMLWHIAYKHAIHNTNAHSATQANTHNARNTRTGPPAAPGDYSRRGWTHDTRLAPGALPTRPHYPHKQTSRSSAQTNMSAQMKALKRSKKQEHFKQQKPNNKELENTNTTVTQQNMTPWLKVQPKLTKLKQRWVVRLPLSSITIFPGCVGATLGASLGW